MARAPDDGRIDLLFSPDALLSTPDADAWHPFDVVQFPEQRAAVVACGGTGAG